MKKIWIAVILMLGVLFVANWLLYTQPLVPDVTQAEADHIIAELRARRAGNCVVTDQGSYWRAEEMATGKVFKVTK